MGFPSHLESPGIEKIREKLGHFVDVPAMCHPSCATIAVKEKNTKKIVMFADAVHIVIQNGDGKESV